MAVRRIKQFLLTPLMTQFFLVKIRLSEIEAKTQAEEG